jgi:macrolide-specific efflux system membrane fusion protein
MKKLIVLCLLLAAGAGAWWLYRVRGDNGDDPLAYEPVAFQRRRLENTIESTGVVEPRNRLEIKPPISGRIDEVLVTEGQQVAKSEIVARMSSTERATLLDAARARGEATLRKWEDVYKPTPLVAPLAGTIIARHIEPGQTVTIQDPVLVLSDRLIVTAQVDETDIGSVRPGQAATLSLDAYPDVVVRGVVGHVAYEAVTVNNVTIYEVEVEPEQVPDCMKSGMTATVAFLVAAADDVLTLPSDAVSRDNGKSVVLVDADGKPETPPERWRVLTGLSDDGRVEVLAGLDGNERVVRKAFRIERRKDEGNSPFMPFGRRRKR